MDKPKFEPPDHLLDQIKEGKCIAFVGAGFSRPAGIPIWRDLLQGVLDHESVKDCITSELRIEVEKLLDIGAQESYDQAAQMLEDRLGNKRFQKVFADFLRVKKFNVEKGSPMYNRLEMLYDIPFKAILTTNFDTLINNSMSYFDVGAVHKCHDILRKSPANFGEQLLREDDSTPVIQIHGSIKEHPIRMKKNKLSIRDPSEENDQILDCVDDVHMVCTRRGYRHLLHEHESYQHFIRAVMSNYTILYIGNSFTDIYLNEWRGSILNMLEGTVCGDEGKPLAYAITNDRSPLDQKFYYNHEGVKFLNYDTTSESAYMLTTRNELNRILKELQGSCSQETREELRKQRNEIEIKLDELEAQTKSKESQDVLAMAPSSNDHVGFEEILEVIRDKTSPEKRFEKVLSGKHILWCDPQVADTTSDRGKLRKKMKEITKGKQKVTIEPCRSSDEALKKILENNSSQIDLIITPFEDQGNEAALRILQKVNHMRASGNISCPLVIVHDDNNLYQTETSEARKGKVIYQGALDYTTDAISLVSVIYRAFSVFEDGRDRKNIVPVPRSSSQEKKRKSFDDVFGSTTKNPRVEDSYFERFVYNSSGGSPSSGNEARGVTPTI